MRSISRYVFSFLMIVSGSFSNDLITVTGSGISKQSSHAFVIAKSFALDAAIVPLLNFKTEIENYNYNKENVLKSGMRLLSIESKEIANTKEQKYKVTISATIKQSKLLELLASQKVLLSSAAKPKLLVIISEEIASQKDPSNRISEQTIIDFLTNDFGFTFIDPAVATSIRSSKQKLSHIQNDPKTASLVAHQYGADYLIIGKSVSQVINDSAVNLGGMIPVEVQIKLDIINCISGEVISSIVSDDQKIHFSPQSGGVQAAAEAAKKAAKELIDPLMINYTGQTRNGIILNVTIKSVSGVRMKNAIIQTLHSHRDVLSIKENFWDPENNTVEIDIQYRGSTAQFCNKFNRYHIKSGRGTLLITGTSGTRIFFINQVL